jgi:hypothetical protein
MLWVSGCDVQQPKLAEHNGLASDLSGKPYNSLHARTWDKSRAALHLGRGRGRHDFDHDSSSPAAHAWRRCPSHSSFMVQQPRHVYRCCTAGVWLSPPLACVTGHDSGASWALWCPVQATQGPSNVKLRTGSLEDVGVGKQGTVPATGLCTGPSEHCGLANLCWCGSTHAMFAASAGRGQLRGGWRVARSMWVLHS